MKKQILVGLFLTFSSFALAAGNNTGGNGHDDHAKKHDHGDHHKT